MKKYVAMTGASSGIGREAAMRFAQRGKNLILVARNADGLEAVKKEIAALDSALEVVVTPADLSQKGNAHALYESLKNFAIETWINNAGFGDYRAVHDQDLAKMERMLGLNVAAVAILSTLYAHDYRETDNAQLINISSVGGYTIVPTAVTYCASKFFVSAFTEGLARELIETGAKMRAKVFAPAATKTNFGNVANGIADYDYDKSFGTYHTCAQTVDFLMRLYDSALPVGLVDRETFAFSLCDYQFNYAGNSKRNQRLE
ncbi:MAG: SDR family NAD(P)-dependent oxidoreductase [Treponemataceae bacterium]|nr:SDR family NAD(P)-dependent oxidoreductase [Treponemataceae bacterium]